MPNKSNLNLICGLEIHAELNTASKMFCGCANDPFHAEQPNSHTCPVCLGMPGGIPVPNKQAIINTIKLGLALGCKINLESKFDRKHYFYPDLAKGYQISQYDQPFCYDGSVDTSFGPVKIRRIHLEEDTGKLLHTKIGGEEVSLIDFNRSGVPLVEIVTQPDIRHAEQAKEFGKKLHHIIRYLGIGDADMEQGGMRLEANISLSPDVNKLPNYKVEVKNINSFRFLEQAITYEVARQADVLDKQETPKQETRGFNNQTGQTFSQRPKEDAEDYRYFPDPDIAPIRFSDEDIANWRAELPVLPEDAAAQWQTRFNLDVKFGLPLIKKPTDVDFLSNIFTQLEKDNLVATFAKAVINKKIKVDKTKSAVEIAQQFAAENKKPDVNIAELEAAIKDVISNNPSEVERYQQGKTELLNFFVGQTIKQLGKKTDMQLLRTEVQKKLTTD